MAYVNGKWIPYSERRELINKLKRYIVPRVRNKHTLSKEEKIQLSNYISEYNRISDIHRGETDLLFFSYFYFGDNYNEGNSGNWIPHYETYEDNITRNAPDFHHEICDIMNVVSNKEVNKRVAVAAPRSHAKSSFLSKAFPIHEIVYRKRKYIILISETPAVSSANLEWISLQLKNNLKLHRDFGRILNPNQKSNPKDNGHEFVCWEEGPNNTKNFLTLVQAASTGQALRGRNWNGTRPDLIVCDDLEDKRNTNTEQLREELRDWFRQVVVPLGDPEGKKTAIVFMGTTVHPESLLLDVIHNRGDFSSKIYRAIINPPNRMDLWEECRKIYVNRESTTNERDAELFYTAHKEEMLEGSKVLWNKVQNLFKLMKWKWDNGSKAFNTEYMNNPIDTESMIFNPEKFVYWDDKDPYKDYLTSDYDIYMGIDFAMGKERGDYSAITTIARHKVNDVSYILDSFGERLNPKDFLDVIVDKVIHYQPDGIAAEAQMAQEFFVDQLKELLTGTGYPAHTRVRKIKQRTKKELRIEGMLPDIESGKIQFSRKHMLLLEQFERYGTNSHDDLPDSLEMAFSISKKRRARMVDKPHWI